MKSIHKISLFMLICFGLIFVYLKQASFAGVPQGVPQYNVPFERMTKDTQKQIECLAENIYFEARNEPLQGQYAVAFVTMNRVNSSYFPNTICDVVKQKTKVESIGNKRVVCQFSWWCEPTPYHISTSNLLTKTHNMKYNEIVKIAINFYVNYERLEDPTQGSLFYHADYVSPNWKNLQKVTQIGRHIFYERKSNVTIN
jgi:spore germination cell wall hydrolase CwlJ-like protein